MKINRAFGMALGLMMGAAPMAFADNVIVGTPQPAAPAQTAPVVVQAPQAVAPVAVDEPNHRAVVRADVSPPHSYMGTIAGGAVLGALTGVLIGGAIYYLGDQTHAYNIAYWAAGGVLVGTGVGLAQIIVQESRASRVSASTNADPAPTLRLALYQARF